jgi:hypothetical protein
MARFNKVFAGPVDQAKPQVQERICATAVLPGTALVESGANFAQAGANAAGKIYIAQDNYLALKDVDTAWPAGDRVIGMEPLDEMFFNVRVPTGQNVARGAALTTSAAGKFVLATTGQRAILLAEEAFNNNTGADQLVRARKAQPGMVVA